MKPIENNTPNYVFRFVNPRGVKKVEETAQGGTLDPTVLYPYGDEGDQQLYARLADIPESDYEGALSEVQTFKTEPDFFTDMEAIEAALPGLHAFHEWVFSHLNFLTKSDVLTKVTDCFVKPQVCFWLPRTSSPSGCGYGTT